jgi:flagellar hook-associated protein 3 FlgL
MRITNTLQRDQTLRDIQTNLSQLANLQSQIATGKRFTQVAQDPLGAAQVLRVQQGLRALQQYGQNATAAQVRLGAEEAVVQQAGDLLSQARNFASSFAKGDPPYTADQTQQRQIAKDQIQQILDSVIALGNTQIGGEYILGGANSTTPPFDTTPGATYGDYQGGTTARQIQIADGVSIEVNHTGDQYLGPAIAALKALRDAVDPANNQTEANVQTQINAVYDAGQKLLVSDTETGLVGKQIVNTLNNQASIKNNLQNIQSAVQDVPDGEAEIKLLSLQTTVQASYAATGRVLGLSLTEYL